MHDERSLFDELLPTGNKLVKQEIVFKKDKAMLHVISKNVKTLIIPKNWKAIC